MGKGGFWFGVRLHKLAFRYGARFYRSTAFILDFWLSGSDEKVPPPLFSE